MRAAFDDQAAARIPAMFRLVDGDELKLCFAFNLGVGAGNEANGSFTLEKAGKLTLHVTDTAGQPSTDSFSAPLTLIQNWTSLLNRK